MGKLNLVSVNWPKSHLVTGTALLLSLPLFIASASESSASPRGQEPGASPYIQLASTTRYNFGRAQYRSGPRYYKKKRKYRKKVVRKSHKKRLAEIKTWDVDENNKDPIQLVVSRTKQTISVYKGKELVVTSNISSGKKGHDTPTGVFSILGKRVFHRSNIYSRAPMPYMQRLTWSGIALHGSNSVPAHPASHGCVRLPNSFAPKLFKFTERGAHVIIADETPRIVELSGLNLLKPLSPEVREKELAKIRQELIQKEIAARKEAEAKLVLKTPQKQTESQEEKTESAEAKKPEAPNVEVKLSPSPIRILITRRLGRERIRDAQDMLKELGFEPGESDGYMGKDTGKAILAFQEAQGLQKTGAFSDELERQLYKLARKKEAPTGYLYVRQDFKNLMSTPITIKDPHFPLGTHLITAQHFTGADTVVRWRGMTLKDKVPEFLAQDGEKLEKQTEVIRPVQVAQIGNVVVSSNSASSKQTAPVTSGIDSEKAAEIERQKLEERLNAESRQKIQKTLARIKIPQSVATRLSLLLTPGSSIAISDKGLSKETTPHGTDFILLTR